jgi:splicing factor 3B subunit 2
VRNSVPVPKHWNNKRRYLQYKRGVHKKPFTLPDFIENTGINKLRNKNDDAGKSLKQRMRERIQPKMGKIDIDYNILHDAFFKHQRRPEMSKHGDIYFEGRECEIKKQDLKPGRMSATLCDALGITDSSPPPWIMNM